MSRIVVIGGGVCGLTTAMLLARDGHEVTVLERDAAAPPDTPDDAWFQWERRGVNQFRMIHFFAPRYRALLDAELPDVMAEAEALGALRYNPMRLVPEEMIGGFRETDKAFEAVTARRPVMEAAISRACARTPGLDVRRGVTVSALITDGEAATGVPNVVGVRTEAGEEIACRSRRRRRGPPFRFAGDVGRNRCACAPGGARGFRLHVLRAAFPRGRR